MTNSTITNATIEVLSNPAITGTLAFIGGIFFKSTLEVLKTWAVERMKVKAQIELVKTNAEIDNLKTEKAEQEKKLNSERRLILDLKKFLVEALRILDLDMKELITEKNLSKITFISFPTNVRQYSYIFPIHIAKEIEHFIDLTEKFPYREYEYIRVVKKPSEEEEKYLLELKNSATNLKSFAEQELRTRYNS